MKEVYANRIVGYLISDPMTAQLAVDALENAVARRGDVAGYIVHADRGTQVSKPTHSRGAEPSRDARLDGSSRIRGR